MNEGTFDHTAGCSLYTQAMISIKKPFRYLTMWKHNDKFMTRVSDAWQVHVRGTKIFSVVQRLKSVNKELKDLNKQGFSDVQATYTKTLLDMHNAQSLMHSNPGQQEFANAELRVVARYRIKHKIYTEFLKQIKNKNDKSW